VASQGSELGREAHEKKREGLRVYVWTYYFPGPGRGMRWQQPYIYISIEGGYAVRVRDILVLEAENRSAVEPVTGRLVASYRVDRTIEPPCHMISLRRLNNAWRTLAAFNRSASHVAVVTWEGKTYYGAIRMPNATLAYPCAPDSDRNSFDLHIIGTPEGTLSLVSWQALRGSCTAERRGNQLKLSCSAFAAVRLNATDSSSYVFERWNIEGVEHGERSVVIVLDQDYTANARFRRPS